MQKITVEIDARWVKRIKSPSYKYVIDGLFGVSVTFAPLGLYWFGSEGKRMTDPWVVFCFLVVYFVPFFYFRLAGEVITQLEHKEQKHEEELAR